MKILLIALYDHYSKGIRGLHSFLAGKGHDVSSLYFKTSTYEEGLYRPQEIGAVIDKARELQPDFIGIGVKSPLFPVFADICNHIRVSLPKVKIIAGGPHATASPETCAVYADYVVRGDGEYPMLDILDGCTEGIMPWKRVTDLDSLPFQHYGENTFQFAAHPAPIKLSVYTTRGCFFSCSYCQESVLRQTPVRKSVKYFKEEIDYFRSLFPSVKLLTMSDSNFIYDMDWLEAFATEFSNTGLRIWCAGHAKTIMANPEMLDILKAAGVTTVRIGVQSGSEQLRKDIYYRKDTLNEVLEVANLLHQKNMVGHYDFIIENPYDTPKTIADTRRFIRKLPLSALTNKFELRYWPGTGLTKRALKDGYIIPDDVEGNYLRFGDWTYMYQLINPGG